MRKINLSSILFFLLLNLPPFYAALQCALIIQNGWGYVLSFIVFYIMMLVVYRVFLFFRPLGVGYYQTDSREEQTYNIYVLFYLIYLNPLLPTLRIPIPLMRLIYLALGAKMGNNSYSAGVMMDPPLIEIGENTILGFDSVICPHAIEGSKIFFAPIKIGSRVTIGMRSIIMAGSILEDDCIIAAGSLVTKGTHVKKGEVWMGTPARLYTTRTDLSLSKVAQ